MNNNRIVDLIFPSLVLGDEHLESEEARAKREEKVWKRKAASQKVQNWRANGKPVVSAGEASRLGNPVATTDRSPRPPVSQTALANDVIDYGVLRLYATQADNNCSSMRMMRNPRCLAF